MNTPSSTERPKEVGYYLCQVRRWATGGWRSIEQVLHWDGKNWSENVLYGADFDGIYSFEGPLYNTRGYKAIRDQSSKTVSYSQ